MNSMNTWNAQLYDEQLRYVSEFGKGVLPLLNAQDGEHILDLGCGTGDLTYELALSGARVIGIDYSHHMIRQAQEKYPDLTFILANAENYRPEEEYDAIFSNAALHWMKNAEEVIATLHYCLKPGGRFVAEFGGKGNVGTIIEKTNAVLTEDFGLSDVEQRNPWYFPSIAEYSTLLEKQGFRVAYAEHFDRPTPLQDGRNGLRHWLASFTGDFFLGMTESQREAAYQLIMARCESELFDGSNWYADYKRIRIAAFK